MHDEHALDRIRTICATLPHAEEGELQGRPLFHVRRRRFAIFNGEGSPARPRWDGCGRSLHVLIDADERDAVGQDPCFAPSPHHGDRGWYMLRLDGTEDWDEIGELLESAYRQVV